jgi:hypothetical protein
VLGKSSGLGFENAKGDSVKTVFRIDVTDQRRQLILRVGREMGIEKYGGYVLFDDSDYADYPNPKWRKRALHFNVHRGVEEISPEHILQLINLGHLHRYWIFLCWPSGPLSDS